jgi:hypothetical protein
MQLEHLKQITATLDKRDPDETETEDDEDDRSKAGKTDVKTETNGSEPRMMSPAKCTTKQIKTSKVTNGVRLRKQQQEIETVLKATTDPLYSLIETMKQIVPAVATFPNVANTQFLKYYLPPGTDTSKVGMQNQNRNPIVPYIFYKSMSEDMPRLLHRAVKQVEESLTAFISKYRHRHVNNRRKHLRTDLNVEQFDKSVAQLAHDQEDLKDAQKEDLKDAQKEDLKDAQKEDLKDVRKEDLKKDSQQEIGTASLNGTASITQKDVCASPSISSQSPPSEHKSEEIKEQTCLPKEKTKLRKRKRAKAADS